MFGKIITLGAIAVVLSIGSAQAGGLFGCKGSKSLFRGSVGCAVAPIQKKVLTPMLQEGVRQGGRALGNVVAGPIGGEVGAFAGDVINNTAAGGGRFEAAQPQPVEMQQVADAQPQQFELGNFCTTGYGRVGPGPANPLGSACTGFVPGVGSVPGQVTY